MSYTKPDFADDVQRRLKELGYEVRFHHEADGWTWHFGDANGDKFFRDESEAWFGAFTDLSDCLDQLAMAAGIALSRWSRGNLAEAIRDLQDAYDAVTKPPPLST